MHNKVQKDNLYIGNITLNIDFTAIHEEELGFLIRFLGGGILGGGSTSSGLHIRWPRRFREATVRIPEGLPTSPCLAWKERTFATF
jgi:hypothetical protein